MDNFLNLTSDKDNSHQERAAEQPKASSSGSGGFVERISHMVGGGEQKPAEEQKPVGFTEKIHGMLGGGRESEKKEG